MSEVLFETADTIDRPSLADLLNPMQFKTVLLVTCGVKNCQIAEFLGTTEQAVEKELSEIYSRTGCSGSAELVRRYFREVAGRFLNLGRLERELADLEARSTQILRGRSGRPRFGTIH